MNIQHPQEKIIKIHDYHGISIELAEWGDTVWCGKNGFAGNNSEKSLGQAPWTGGIPPYNWIGEQIAPNLGYTYGSDTLPIIEYYGFFDPEKGQHEYCYLYVPTDAA